MSIFAHTKQVQGLFGLDEKLDTDSLSLRYGTIEKRIYTGSIADNGHKVILRGKWASSRSEATVLFIEAVLDTGERYRSEFLKEMEEMAEAKERRRRVEGAK